MLVWRSCTCPDTKDGARVLDGVLHSFGGQAVVLEIDALHIGLGAHVHRKGPLWQPQTVGGPPIGHVGQGCRSRFDVERIPVARRHGFQIAQIGILLHRHPLDGNGRIDHQGRNHGGDQTILGVLGDELQGDEGFILGRVLCALLLQIHHHTDILTGYGEGAAARPLAG